MEQLFHASQIVPIRNVVFMGMGVSREQHPSPERETVSLRRQCQCM